MFPLSLPFDIGCDVSDSTHRSIYNISLYLGHIFRDLLLVFLRYFAILQEMPSNRCVVQNCSNVSNPSEGISIHRSPSNSATYAKWIRFVRMHRAKFSPQGTFVVCSEHFSPECFQRVHMQGSRRILVPDSIPTIWKANPQKPTSSRTRRKVS